MNAFFTAARYRTERLYLLCFLLLIPALFANLGEMPVIADEPTRAVVAMEMEFSENYVVSTINGEYYYRKPPLFNWLLAGLFELTGSQSEWVIRLSAVIPLILFGLHLFRIVRRYFNIHVAFFTSAMFLTCGRMLIYDSMLGHIDILYSWLTFWSFERMYHYFRQEKYTALFVVTYLISAATFLLKGLPTLLFQGFTLVALFYSRKKFKLLFSFPHLLGIMAFLVPVAGFFLIYLQYNSLEGWLDQLWDQSKQRTVLDKAWYENFIHIFKFPVDHLMHLAPWSLLAVFCFRKGLRKEALQNDFMRFMLLALLINLPVYWLSPGYYPRYLFMLYPIVFLYLAFAWFQSRELMPRTRKTVEYIFLGGGIISALAPFGILWVDMPIDYKWLKILSIFLLSALVCYAYLRQPDLRMGWFVVLLLLFRMSFNWFVIPHRVQYGELTVYRDGAIEVGKLSKGQPLYVYQHTGINHGTTYYIERERQEILYGRMDADTTSLYIALPLDVSNKQYDKLMEFTIEFEQRVLYLIKFREEYK